MPGLGPPGPDLGERLLDEVQRARRGVRLEVGARAVTLDGVGQRCPGLAVGIFHSNVTSGLLTVRGRLICTL